MDRIRGDDADLPRVSIHHWQERNPVTTEALVQLTLGAPQHLYNGGLLVAPVRYFDAERGRPGLPADVAALVTGVTQDSIALQLANLSLTGARSVRIQAGSLGEHTFTSARFTGRAPDSRYPAAAARYEYGADVAAPPDPAPVEYNVEVNSGLVDVHMRPGTDITMTLGLRRNVRQAGYTPAG